MRIVLQLAPPAHSQFLMLSAPQIAGLIPARVPSSIPEQVIIAPKRMTKRDIEHARWAAQDAELEAFMEGARQRIAAAYADMVRSREADYRAWGLIE